MADARDYVTSSLALTPYEEALRKKTAGADPLVEARARGGNPMTRDEENTYREEMSRHAERLAKRAAHPGSTAADTALKVLEAMQHPIAAAATYGPEVAETAKDYLTNPSAPIEDILKRPEALSASKTAPTAKTDEPDATSDQTIQPAHRIGSYRDANGNIVFTNIGVSPETEAATYRSGVKAFRERAASNDIAGILAANALEPRAAVEDYGGLPIHRGNFVVRQGAPITGDIRKNPDTGEEYTYEGGATQPFMADPNKRLSAEGWAAMSPGARDEFRRQVAEISGEKQAQAGGTLAEHEARMATEPGYFTEHRLGMYTTFFNEALSSNEVQANTQAIMAEIHKNQPNLKEGTPEWDAAEQQAKKAAVTNYLKEKYAQVAPWDDVLSKAQGLVF